MSFKLRVSDEYGGNFYLVYPLLSLFTAVSLILLIFIECHHVLNSRMSHSQQIVWQVLDKYKTYPPIPNSLTFITSYHKCIIKCMFSEDYLNLISMQVPFGNPLTSFIHCAWHQLVKQTKISVSKGRIHISYSVRCCVIEKPRWYLDLNVLFVCSWCSLSDLLKWTRSTDGWCSWTQRSNSGGVSEQRSCGWCGLPLSAPKSLLDRHRPK